MKVHHSRWSPALIASVTMGLLCLHAGCAVFEPMQTASRQVMKSLSFRGSDRKDWTDAEDPAWVSQVGEEARGDRPREADPDKFINDLLMSNKARSIERNLGYGE